MARGARGVLHPAQHHLPRLGRKSVKAQGTSWVARATRGYRQFDKEGFGMPTRAVGGLALIASLGAWLLTAGAAGAFQFKDEAGKFEARFPAQPTLDKREGQSATGPHVHHTWEV